MRKALLLAATLPLLAVAAPADAARVRGCAGTGHVWFNPPLTVDPHAGTATWSYTSTCAVAYSSGATGVDAPYSGTNVFSYFGSCATATLTKPGTVGVLVGGTSATFATTSPTVFPGEWVLVAGGFDPCAMSGALSVGVGPEVAV